MLSSTAKAERNSPASTRRISANPRAINAFAKCPMLWMCGFGTTSFFPLAPGDCDGLPAKARQNGCGKASLRLRREATRRSVPTVTCKVTPTASSGASHRDFFPAIHAFHHGKLKHLGSPHPHFFVIGTVSDGFRQITENDDGPVFGLQR